MCVPPHLECLVPGMSVILGVSWWRGVGARVGGLGSEVQLWEGESPEQVGRGRRVLRAALELELGTCWTSKSRGQILALPVCLY